MITKKFSSEEILDKDLVLVDVRGWRHGTRDTYVFEHAGVFWRFTAEHHFSEGLQISDPTEAVQVRKVQRIAEMWEPVE